MLWCQTNVNPLAEWLGSGGKTVSYEQAQSRAIVCQSCSENCAPRWWEISHDSIASCIRQILELKAGMKLKVSNEDSLHMCRACGCCIRLKVWTPLSHIVEHSDTSKLPDHCWVRRES